MRGLDGLLSFASLRVSCDEDDDMGEVDGLRGFASLRTRPIERPLQRPKRRCSKCNAVLRDSNSDPCAPCAFGHVEIPDWAQELAERDDRPWSIRLLAQVLGVKLDMSERNAKMCATYRKGGMTHKQLGQLYGLKPYRIGEILRAGGVGRPKAGRPNRGGQGAMS